MLSRASSGFFVSAYAIFGSCLRVSRVYPKHLCHYFFWHGRRAIPPTTTPLSTHDTTRTHHDAQTTTVKQAKVERTTWLSHTAHPDLAVPSSAVFYVENRGNVLTAGCLLGDDSAEKYLVLSQPVDAQHETTYYHHPTLCFCCFTVSNVRQTTSGDIRH